MGCAYRRTDAGSGRQRARGCGEHPFRRALNSAGVRAVGLTGADGGCGRVRRRPTSDGRRTDC
jgi:hypothetical protein